MITYVLRFVALVAAAVICKTAYNVFLHPLRRYPGPWFARASRLYYAYHLWGGTYCSNMIKLHKKYGPVLRIAPDELSYASAQAWQDIYGQTFANRTADLEKDRSWYMVASNGVDSIITAPFDVHYRFRRLLQVPLSDRALVQQERLIQGYIDLLIQRLHENAATKEDPQKKLDVVQWIVYTCFDVLGDLAFGESFGCLDRGESHWWINDIQEGVKAAFKIKTIERFIPGFFSLFMKVMILVGTAMAKNPEENFNFCAHKARARLARSSDRPDFITYISEANKQNQDMTKDEIESNSQVLINAGTEPVATATCGVLFHLASHPEALAKAVMEIRSSFSSEADMTISATQQLPYLRAVIEEGMRMYPPAPSTFPRTTPPSGCTICGEYVPGGYSVGVNQSAVMSSEAIWVQPDRYAPERWLQDPEFAADDKKAYQPYSLGGRNCIGKSLAQAEMRLIISRILWSFDIQIAPESRYWNIGQKTNAFWEKPPMYVTLTPVVR